MVAAVKLYEGHSYQRIRETVEEIDGKIYTHILLRETPITRQTHSLM